YPDRSKFEQIRARWETAQLGEDAAVEMVGWRDRPVPQPPVTGEGIENNSSKFRRKLSHGLAFISNPLSQRKTTPGRHPVKVPSPAVTEPSTSETTTVLPVCEAQLPSARRSTSSERANGSAPVPATPQDKRCSIESPGSDATPRPLPRSRTLSFIPLPVKVEHKSFAADVEGAVKSHTLTSMPQPDPKSVPSKIPTPSPPLPERRRSSPRQYLHQHASYHASQPIKHIAAAHAFAAANNGSPAINAIRSRTTPNMMKGPNTSQSARFMAPRRPGVRKPDASPTTLKSSLQENVPTDKRVTQRRSQTQEKPLRRESLAMQGILTNRGSFGPGTPLAQSRQPSFATPPTARKRLSSQLAQQTPVTARRVQPPPGDQTKPQGPNLPSVRKGSIAAPSSLASPPATPTLRTLDLAKPNFPQSHADKDPQRKTLGTPNGLAGVWRSSRALAATTHEVRRLPRSHTFHNFGAQWEAAPPVPPIPEQYKTSSLSNLTQDLRMTPDIPIQPRIDRLVSDTTSCGPIPEDMDEERQNRTSAFSPDQPERERPPSVELSGLADSLTALTSVPSLLGPSFTYLSTTTSNTGSRSSSSLPKRPWHTSEKQCSDSADVDPFFQVKDYMPPLYWAGRFQSRYDQWRTHAMTVELDLKPNTNGQPSGLLSECTLDQENLAACYIFGQLRDLCTSDQAADSLWDFEYRYRKEHKLLGSQLDLPPMPPRRQDDSTTSKNGAFGRAMRKLTPRKASLVNLMKGKG
ncbi:hypothetical protein BDW02DRAFT_479913, partial [Decorospora gaudefroyi]